MAQPAYTAPITETNVYVRRELTPEQRSEAHALAHQLYIVAATGQLRPESGLTEAEHDAVMEFTAGAAVAVHELLDHPGVLLFLIDQLAGDLHELYGIAK